MKKSAWLRYPLFLLVIVLLGFWLWKIVRGGSDRVSTADSLLEALVEGRPRYLNPDLTPDERARDLVSRMTSEEKIGQLILVDRRALEDENDIAKYGIGALLSGAGSNPEDNTPNGWREMINRYQSVASQTRLGIPLLYGVDAIHGHANIPTATIFPHQIGLGAANDPGLVEQINRAVSAELLATGVNWSFSPSLDVALDNRWGRVYESFGSDVARVVNLAGPAIRGLQGEDPNSVRVISTAKHYLGGGATAWGTSANPSYELDQGDALISESTLRRDHLPPFQEAVRADVWSVMAGLSSWQAEKLSSHHYLLTDVLKNELDFQGFVVSDWHGVYDIPGNDYLNTAAAINAGLDLVMLPYDYKRFTADVRQALDSGRLSYKRLDDAVLRILRAKFALGLFDNSIENTNENNILGSIEHRLLAREAVRKSLVLLKDGNSSLPLSKELKTIAVSGSAADNTGFQSGGWTIEWQGTDGNTIPGATSILAAIKQAVSQNTSVSYNQAGLFAPGYRAEVGIAIVGEKPYAEGFGDDPNPSLSDEDLKAIQNLRRVSDKLVVVVVSGRPLDIKQAARNWDVVIAAWLPGSEGQGVTDVMFGDYNFSGTLPVVWDR